MSENNSLSRREIIAGVGAMAVGAAFAQLGGIVSKADARGGTAEKWPWPYEKLDPDRVGETSYHAWYEVFCSQAVATGIFEQLREKVGEPWASFPIGSLRFGMGGMLGWGLTCGAPVAGSLIIGLTAPSELVNPMINDLLQWYSETPIPVYMPKSPRFKGEIPKTTAGNPLCHVSVGKWMKAANRSFPSDERRHRCARLTASVAVRTAEILNAWKDGKYAKRDTWAAVASVGIPAQQDCMSCHGANIPTAPRAK
jgi:hypothetical protein